MRRLLISALGLTGVSAHAVEYDFEPQARALVESQLAEIVSNPIVIAGIMRQNEMYTDLTQAEVEALDQRWRAGDVSLIETTLANEVSQYLDGIKAEGLGLFTELIIMDKYGLNVGQSDRTSDYWQGDEAKWQETYLKGTDAMHVSEVEEDESSLTFQIQVSIPVVSEGTNIGAFTVGVDVDILD